MATQAAMIMETVLGMRKVLDPKEDSSDSEEPYLQPPNWGNKLKRKANYTIDGRPIKKIGRASYARNIEYGGHHRDILRRNPKRYDEDGEELGSEEEDEEADARAAEENPYAEIHLEALMAPLTSAANLANHPSLSQPYLSSTLTNMAQHACETIHRERNTLCNAKLLLRRLRGDEVWIPTELLNSPHDKDIFDTERVYNTIVAETLSRRPNGSAQVVEANGDIISRTVSGSTNKEGINTVEAVATQEDNPVREATQNLAPEDSDNDDPMIEEAHDSTELQDHGMIDKLDPEEKESSLEATGTEKEQDDERVDVIGPDITADQDIHLTNGDPPIPEPSAANEHAISKSTTKIAAEADLDRPIDEGVHGEKPNIPTSPAPEAMDEDEDSNQAPQPRRMRTRAQAAATSEPAISPQTASPEPPYVPPPIHPLFLLPALVKPDPDYGLPPQEAEETRRMLMIYVQKQEEVCRSVEKLYQSLLRADRERKTVLSWSKAEGHVGEMSDGEDWCDKEEWGLDEDLRKGEGDDKEGDEGTAGKKTRGRRA